ncbi:MAG TPA: VOC family protein [Candidatus Dormibacteraeota bacterium]|nr:VOC family protein [Candidatus Dormibacteraeota bacterium]
MTLPARFSLATLGVRDVVRSTRFYQALGWPLSKASVPGEVSFFDTDGGILAVWGDDELAKDSGLAGAPVGPGAYRGSAYAINLDTPADVDELLTLALKAGGRITRPAQATDWGGYNGYFADPDGHLWEVAHNPHWPIGPNGRPILP